jgi:hypothetical protein
MSTRDERRNLARQAVSAQMADRGINPTDVARQAKINPDTIGDFLAGTRWPKIGTQGKIERALNWPPGTISQIESTGRAPVVRSARSEVDLIRELAERLPPTSQAALLSYAAYLDEREQRSGSTGH